MDSLYELNFVTSKAYSNSLTQHQIGANFTLDSYLLMYDKWFEENDNIIEHIKNFEPLVFFKDASIEYINGGVSKDTSNIYDEYIQNLYEHTTKLERYTPRAEGFEFTIPLVKNGYNINGKFSVNVVALFGYNYYTDERIDKTLECLGYLYFTKDYIPLYNTREYGMQINAKLSYSLNLFGGKLEYSNNNQIKMIRTYYNGDDAIGINIMNNLMLE